MIFAHPSAEKSILDARKLKIAREAQTRDGSLQLVVRELGFDSEEQAVAAVGNTLGMEIVDLAKTKIDLAALESFPIKFIHRHMVFPLGADGDSLVWRSAIRSICTPWTRSARPRAERGAGRGAARRVGQAD